MQHLKEIFDKDPKMLDSLLHHKVKVTTKLDGSAFQVYYDEDEDNFTYHKRSGNTNKVGPEISKYDKLYSKRLNHAIDAIENVKDKLSEYKFLTFEVFDDKLVLLSVVTKDNQLIEDIDEISKIAVDLDVSIVPIVFDGNLDEEQINLIKLFVGNESKTGEVPEGFESYVDFISKLFKIDGEDHLNELMIEDGMEGVVFDFDVSGKSAQYKLVDPEFSQKHRDSSAQEKADKEKVKPFIKQLIDKMHPWLKDHAEALDDDYMESLYLNFINMASDAKLVNELINIAANIPSNKNTVVQLDTTKLPAKIQDMIKRFGPVFKNMFEKYLSIFLKKRTRQHVIDKAYDEEFIWSIIDKIKKQ